jgi:hypothetical protein
VKAGGEIDLQGSLMGIRTVVRCINSETAEIKGVGVP